MISLAHPFPFTVTLPLPSPPRPVKPKQTCMWGLKACGEDASMDCRQENGCCRGCQDHVCKWWWVGQVEQSWYTTGNRGCLDKDLKCVNFTEGLETQRDCVNGWDRK
ncbi:MAG: hypothetical protein Q9211_005855 [Gyalolechia sp. 1 TL-2023]